MRDFSTYSIWEWLKLDPIKFFIKERRNDFHLSLYLKKNAINEDIFIEKCKKFSGKNIILVVAFERPDVLVWLFKYARKNLHDFQILVFDNSKSGTKCVEICNICNDNAIPYLKLPKNIVGHPNRSHGMAMTWIYCHIVKKINPEIFGYLDHDMVPLSPVDIKNKIRSKVCYGALNQGINAWNLWAGYCFFNFEKVKKIELNFLYDFTRQLDTGGRNWPDLYQPLSSADYDYAIWNYQFVNLSDAIYKIDVVDCQWFHLGGVSYEADKNKKNFIATSILKAIDSGKKFESLIVNYSQDLN